MPRFNFKAYLRKTSSTEFSSLHDVHPQAEWEEKHAEQSPEPVTETSDGNALASLESTATPLIGPQLPYEYDALSYDDSAIGSIGEMMDDSSIDYDNVSVDTCTSPEPKGQGGRNLDNIQEKKFEDQNSHYSLEANQSAVVNISIRESVTTPAAEPRTIKTEPNQSMEGQQVSALMYLDNENCLHPVRHTNEINGVVQISRPQKLPLACPEALTRVENIPFEQLAHFTQLGDYVRDLQADERICDVTVHIGTEKYAAHRISLACYSDYFADIFYNQKDTLVPINIRLNDITPMAFEVLLQYIYSGVLPVTSEVVGDLMTMAESLRIPMVRNIVIDYMKHLPLTHALAIVMKGKLFGPLYANTMEAVCGLFNTFTLEDVFLDMDIETILIILNNDNLNISSELDVFKAAMRWIAHDIVDRNQHFLKLMKCIRFPFMTQDELFQCNEFTDLLKENNECMKMFLEATWIVTARNLGKDDPFHLVVPKPRITATTPWGDNDDFYNLIGNVHVNEKSPESTPGQQTISGEKWTGKQRNQTISGEPRHQAIRGEKWAGKQRHQTISGEPRHQTISGEKWTGKTRNQTISGETPISDDKWSEPPRVQTIKDEKRTEKQRHQTISGEPRHQTITGEKWTGKPRHQTISGEPRHQAISGEKWTGKSRNQTISGETPISDEKYSEPPREQTIKDKKWTEKQRHQTISGEPRHQAISGEKLTGKPRHQTISGEPRHQTISGEKWTGKPRNQKISGETPISDEKYSEPPREQTIKDDKWTEKQRNQTISGEPRHQAISGEKLTGKPRHQTISGEPRHQANSGEKGTGKTRNQTISGETPISDDKWSESPRVQTRKDEKWTEKQRHQTISGEPRHQAISGEKLTGKPRHQTISGEPRHQAISGEKWTGKSRNQTIHGETPISNDNSSDPPRDQTIKDEKWSEKKLLPTIKDKKWSEKQRHQTISGEPRHQAISGEKLTGKPRHQTISGEPRHQTISGEKWTGKPRNQTISDETPISDDKYSEPPREQTRNDEKWTEKQRHQTISGEPRHQTISGETWTGKPRSQSISGEPRHQTISGEKLTGKRRNQTISGEKWTEKPLNQTKSCEKTISGEKSGRSNTTGEIIAVGGAITAKTIDIYHSDDNKWKHYCDLPEPRRHFSVTMQNGKVYLTGGIDPRFKVKHPVPTSDAFVFDTKNYMWIKIMPMNTARMNHSSASVNGMVYAIGGQDGNDRVLNTVECYNPKTDNWFFINSMSEARHSVATGVIDDMIFTVGGYGESIGQASEMPVLDTVECYDPQENIWDRKCNLRFPRCYCNLVSVNDTLYLCGGATRSFNSSNSVISSVQSIDTYNKEQDVWEHCTDMVIPRHAAGTASLGTFIYIIGGASTQSKRNLSSVECFDTDTKKWISGVKDIPHPSKWIKCLSLN